MEGGTGTSPAGGSGVSARRAAWAASPRGGVRVRRLVRSREGGAPGFLGLQRVEWWPGGPADRFQTAARTLALGSVFR